MDGSRLAYKLPPMETSTVFDEPSAKLIAIKEKIGRSEYRVDEHAVADAIVCRRPERRPSAAWISAAGRHSLDGAAGGSTGPPSELGIAAPDHGHLDLQLVTCPG